jgi:hypothetical protein
VLRLTSKGTSRDVRPDRQSARNTDEAAVSAQDAEGETDNALYAPGQSDCVARVLETAIAVSGLVYFELFVAGVYLDKLSIPDSGRAHDLHDVTIDLSLRPFRLNDDNRHATVGTLADGGIQGDFAKERDSELSCFRPRATM